MAFDILEDRMMYETIRDYANELGTPPSNWPEYFFREASCYKWAVYELLDYISDHPNCSPLRSVEEFRDKMKDYASRDLKDKETTKIFSVAYEVSLDVYDMLRSIA